MTDRPPAAKLCAVCWEQFHAISQPCCPACQSARNPVATNRPKSEINP